MHLTQPIRNARVGGSSPSCGTTALSPEGALPPKMPAGDSGLLSNPRKPLVFKHSPAGGTTALL